MALIPNEACARRLPFALFILISASLLQLFILVFPAAPLFIRILAIVVFLDPWSGAIKSRLTSLGLPHSYLFLCAYWFFIFGICASCLYWTPDARFFVPALFALLHVPLVFGRDAAEERVD